MEAKRLGEKLDRSWAEFSYIYENEKQIQIMSRLFQVSKSVDYSFKGIQVFGEKMSSLPSLLSTFSFLAKKRNNELYSYSNLFTSSY